MNIIKCKYYYDYISHKYKNHNIKYIIFFNINYDDIFNIYDSIYHDLLQKFNKLSIKYNIKLNIYDNPLFIESKSDLHPWRFKMIHKYLKKY